MEPNTKEIGKMTCSMARGWKNGMTGLNTRVHTTWERRKGKVCTHGLTNPHMTENGAKIKYPGTENIYGRTGERIKVTG